MKHSQECFLSSMSIWTTVFALVQHTPFKERRGIHRLVLQMGYEALRGVLRREGKKTHNLSQKRAKPRRTAFDGLKQRGGKTIVNNVHVKTQNKIKVQQKTHSVEWVSYLFDFYALPLQPSTLTIL